MFAGLNLLLEQDNIVGGGFLKDSEAVKFSGESIYLEQERIVHGALDQYMQPDGSLSAEEIEDDWFPAVDADVFISHSHKDIDIAKSFAAWLYNIFGITSFIDSTVWKYADDLLRQIDNEYCQNGNNTYSYELRNRSTSHVHMILDMALAKMIDRTECYILLNTPESLKAEDVVNNIAYTSSPWIYSELMISGIVRRQLPQRMGSINESFSHREDGMDITYSVPTDHLHRIDLSDLTYIWKYCNGKRYKALNALYKKTGIELPTS